MYNINQKNNYIKYAKYKDRAMNTFAFFAKREEELEQDLCYFTQEELILTINSAPKIHIALALRVDVIHYLEWCTIKDIIPENQLVSLKTNAFRVMYFKKQNEAYISKNMYEKMILMLLQSSHGVYWASFIASIYEGISGEKYENLIHLRLCDIDRKNNTIKLRNGGTKKVSEGLINMLIQTSQVSEITTSVKKKLISSLYADSIWNFSSKALDEKRAWILFTKWMTGIRKVVNNPNLAKPNIEKSGYFNHMMEIFESDGINIRKMATESDDNRKLNAKYVKYFKEYEDTYYGARNMTDFLKYHHSYLQQTK